MKFRAIRRTAALVAAVATEAAGFAMIALPVTAATNPNHHPPHPGTITVTGGGDRTTSNGVSGTSGVRFREQHSSPSACTTGANGTCSVTAPTGSHRVIQENAPAGWFL